MATGTRAPTGLASGPIGLAIIIAYVVWPPPVVSLAEVTPPPSSLLGKPPPEPSEDMSEDLRAQEQAPQTELSGRAASQAPAYTQDFPLLTIACGRR